MGNDYIACSAARRQGTCTNRASIRRSEIERWFVEALRHQLKAPDLVSEFIRTFNDELNRTRRDCDHIEALEARQGEVEINNYPLIRLVITSSHPSVDFMADGIGRRSLRSHCFAVVGRDWRNVCDDAEPAVGTGDKGSRMLRAARPLLRLESPPYWITRRDLQVIRTAGRHRHICRRGFGRLA
jgi:hypothetical protein